MNTIVNQIDLKPIIATNLSLLLRHYNINRKKVCKDLDFRYTTFCDWINGKTYPRMDSLISLASYFDCEVQEFFVEMNDDYLSLKGEIRMKAYFEKLQELQSKKSEQNRTHRTLEERAALYGGELGLDGEPDWYEPEGSEIW